MGRNSLRLRLNTEREKALEQAKETLGVTEDSKAIEAALIHLVQSKTAYAQVKDEITPEQARTLSTDVVSINHYPQIKTKQP